MTSTYLATLEKEVDKHKVASCTIYEQNFQSAIMNN